MKLKKYFFPRPNFYRDVAAIAIPISLQSMITIGVNLMDNIMVGSLGEVKLSAVSQANQVITLFHICCMGIGMGASVLTSRFWGMKDLVSLRKSITIMLRICAGLAVLFMLPTIFAPKFLMSLYTEDADVINEGARYFAYMIPCYLLQGISLTCTIVLRSVGQVRVPLFTSIGAFFINVFFNYVFIFGHFGAPRMAVAGAALGTLIARVFEFAVSCGFFLFKDKKIQYRISNLWMKCSSLVGDYIRISIPVFVSDTLLALGTTMVAMIMGRIGNSFVSANSITMVTQQLSTVLIQGICQAGCIITGHTLGQGKEEEAQKQAYTFLLLGVVIGLIGGLIIFIIRTPIINCYNIEPETKELAYQLMDAIAIIVVFQAMNSIMTKGVLRGGGDTKFLMIADILFLWIVSIPFGALAGLVWHMDAFWIYVLLKVDQIIKAFWCIFRLRSRKWIKKISTKELV